MGISTDGRSYWQAESEGIDLLDITIGDLLDRRADELPTQEAIVYSCYPEFGDALNIRWTYQDYHERANAVTKGLMPLYEGGTAHPLLAFDPLVEPCGIQRKVAGGEHV